MMLRCYRKFLLGLFLVFCFCLWGISVHASSGEIVMESNTTPERGGVI